MKQIEKTYYIRAKIYKKMGSKIYYEKWRNVKKERFKNNLK